MNRLRTTFGIKSASKSSTTEAARSVSDDGSYPEFCARASQDSSTFLRFRSNAEYQRILEHLTVEQGQHLLARIAKVNSSYLHPDVLARVAENDSVGGPPLLMSVGDTLVSPTTLRYLKIAADISSYFSWADVSRVAEVGVGYGGQTRVLDAVGIGREYVLFDLAPVLELASRFLECFGLTGHYWTTTLNQTGVMECDLVLSMYALSELPRPLQSKYYEKVLQGAKGGYLVMNDCWDFDRFSRDEWAKMLNAEIRAEDPETGAGNYVLLWGHLGSGTQRKGSGLGC